MKVQFRKSQYSTDGRSSCLVQVQWMKDQSTTVNPFFLNACSIALVHSYVCLMCMCVCGLVLLGGWMGEEGGGGMSCSKARSSQITLVIRL